MSIGIFIDKEHQPEIDKVCDTLGARKQLWDRLTGFITENYPIPGEWTFGGKNYGWNLWYRKSGKTLVSLYPQKSTFIVQIVLGKDQVAQAMTLKLGKHVGTILKETPQLHDGRWLFIKIKTARDIKDIMELIQIKRKARQGKSACQ